MAMPPPPVNIAPPALTLQNCNTIRLTAGLRARKQSVRELGLDSFGQNAARHGRKPGPLGINTFS
jgi:hypothetical protein